ncbi:hypothetical protein BDA99DRAFT_502651 [Phascolomyces articulosus]|uniref:Aerobactin siderophore biosynthesis IucA/IucC N-terminal domain-containing protein n=1 Tax=Phascolomyces articulosus TaxID=60185 RepID=A0AAD5PIG3_9FUNG|nr:hypothetical protein BDA99DRAFT_502651 [Phascolomyces articulosus]
MVINDYPSTTLMEKNAYYAKFTTASRLIMCLIHEGFVPAYFIKNNNDTSPAGGIVGVCLLLRLYHHKEKIDSQDYCLSSSQREASPPQDLIITLDDVYAAVPIRAFPKLCSSNKDTFTLNGISCSKVEFISSWDMLPFVYGPSLKKKDANKTTSTTRPIDINTFMSNANYIRNQVFHVFDKIGIDKTRVISVLSEGYSSTELWYRFAADAGIAYEVVKDIGVELASTIDFQTYIYNNPTPLPTLQSSAIEWEQMSFEGDINMPAYMSFISNPPISPIFANNKDVTHLLKQPKLRLAAIPRKDMQVSGDFEQLIEPFVHAILAKIDNEPDQKEWIEYKTNNKEYILMPINEIQGPVIQQYIRGAKVLLGSNHHVLARALMSPRTAVCPDILSGITVKYCIKINHSFKLLAMPIEEIEFSHRLYHAIITFGENLSYDRNILTIQPELANAYYIHPDANISRQCSCTIRGSPQFQSVNNDIFIVGSALVERIQKPGTDEVLLTHIWNLDTYKKRVNFLDKYIRLFLKAFIPPCRDNGFVFESHLQNVTVRFDRTTGDIKGFLIRDLGGVDAHNETLKTTCGIDFSQFSCTGFGTYPKIEKLYQRWYNTAVYLHLYPLIHRLGMHEDGHGWHLVRTYFSELVPSSHPMYRYLMEQDKIPIRSILFTKIMSYDVPFVVDNKMNVPCPISVQEHGSIDERGCFYRPISNFLKQSFEEYNIIQHHNNNGLVMRNQKNTSSMNLLSYNDF